MSVGSFGIMDWACMYEVGGGSWRKLFAKREDEAARERRCTVHTTEYRVMGCNDSKDRKGQSSV